MDNQDTEVLNPPPPDGSTRIVDPPPQYRLRRDSRDKMLGGVCSGLGRRYGIDPAVLRVVFVVGVLAAGVGLLAYLAFWLLIPADTEPTDSSLTRSLWRLVLGVLIGVGGVFATFGWIHSLGGFVGMIVGGLLVGLGAWFYYNHEPTRSWGTNAPDDMRAPTGTPPPPTGEPVPEAGFAYGGASAFPYSDPPGANRSATQVPTATWQRQPKDRSYLGLVTFLAMIMVAGLMGAGIAADLIELSAVAYLAILLLILGIGLVIGAFRGRARWLIAPALALALLTGLVAAIPSNAFQSVGNGVGERVWEPTTGNTTYPLGLGSATLDLTDWASNKQIAPPTYPDAVSASVGVGELEVLVPDSWQATVNGTIGVGAFVINGEQQSTSESGIELSEVLTPVGESGGEIILNLEVGAGEISIRQVPVPETSGSFTSLEPSATPTAKPSPTPSAKTNQKAKN